MDVYVLNYGDGYNIDILGVYDSAEGAEGAAGTRYVASLAAHQRPALPLRWEIDGDGVSSARDEGTRDYWYQIKRYVLNASAT